MKKEYKVLVLSFVFVVMSNVAYAMSWEQFIETYPNEYIYRVDFPDGNRNYFSSPYELEFAMEDTDEYGQVLESGKAFVVRKKYAGIVYRLKASGDVERWVSERLNITPYYNVGWDEGVDIYEWNGYGFFLPEWSALLSHLGGVIRTILPIGFGILSVMLLVKLLAVYFKRYILRSL